ncbi:MAG: type II toxin-antitoxin system RelE/ParE family toxin [Pseudomonadota bacterium]
MIKSWKHKGLKKFYDTGSTAGINAKHKFKLQIILQRLDAAVEPNDMNLPDMRFHLLKGSFKGYYSVTVNKNWRVMFAFEGSNAVLVDYLDYH